tara:strand:- start:133 stop:1068 length:936 start_codon:yes stop_codon:yes gene_type:complete
MNILPSNNKSLYGYKEIFSNLKELFDNSRLPNKIIFSGEKGIGKSTLAYHLTNYIFSLCEENKYDFDNNCIDVNNYSYNLILKNTHPNFFFISNDADKNNIQISKVREMINFTNKSSFNNLCKIILIDNIELLNANSVNALLKIIEEPNNNIFFFLVHNNKKQILDTLKSRCIKYNLFLDSEKKKVVIDNLSFNDFYSNLNIDFKNIYNTPSNVLILNDIFKSNNIDKNISIDDFLKLIISKSLYKKDTNIRDNLSYFFELFFKKKINFLDSNDKFYYFYSYFLKKLNDYKLYNLDLESILIEFNGKLLNE